MRVISRSNIIRLTGWSAAIASVVLLSTPSAIAQYYVLARTPSGSGANTNGGAANYGNYWEIGAAYSDSTGKTSAPGVPGTQSGSRYRASALTTSDGFAIQLMADSSPGTTYILDVSVPSSNDSADMLYDLSSTNSTLSVAQTSAFQNNVGTSPNWALVGYVTNNPGGIHPHIQFNYHSGTISGTSRSYATVFRFRPAGCGSVNAPAVLGPFFAGQTNVVVAQVTNATAVTVYQDSGGGMVQVGKLTTGIVNGNNTVATTALVKGAKVTATQTVGGQESCVPTTGAVVGGGANPRIAISLDIRQTGTMNGPIGTPGPNTGGGLYFLQATGMTNSGPVGGLVIQPSTCWQTVRIDPRTAPQSAVWSGSWSGQTSPDRMLWAELECIAFTMNDLSDTGPFAIYIDNFANGTNLFQDFEGYNQGDSVTFLPPNAAGFPVGMLINPPNGAAVSTNQASSGTNSYFANFQFSGGVSGNWVRFYAGAATAAYPELDMTQPIYFDILLLPAGQTNGHSIGSVGYLQDQTNCPGDNVTFSINASGPNPLNFQWQFKGANISGATTSSFTTNQVTPASSGNYSVVVGDGTCTLTRSAALKVYPTVQIDTDPSDPTVINVGDQLGLYGAASAPSTPCTSLAVTYQWLKDGVPIAGATGDASAGVQYIKNNAQIADAGKYSFIASNIYQISTSTVARVYVVDTVNRVPGNGSGLLGLYYSNSLASAPFIQVPAWTNTDSQIGFEWGAGAPDASYNASTLVGSNNFTVRWLGQIAGEWNQTYTLYTTNDDGIRVWVNNQLVINSWVDQGGTTEHSGVIPLTTSPQPIVIEYYEHNGNAGLELSWDSASQVKEVVPMAQIYPAAGYPSAPLITLSSPADNSAYTNPATVSLAALVTPNLNGIDKVQFYYGSTPVLIGEVANPPYTLNWANPAAGSYPVLARVLYDNSAEHVDSSSATIAVTTEPPNIAATTFVAPNLTISGTGVSGQTFVLLKASSLSTPISWTPVATNSAGTGSFNFVITVGSNPGSAFFKVQSK